jgi:hypothetical protein
LARVGWEVCGCKGVQPGGGEGGLGQAGRCAGVQVLSLVVERVGQGKLELPCGSYVQSRYNKGLPLKGFRILSCCNRKINDDIY